MMDYKVTATTKNECDEVAKPEFDPVTKPRHYNREGAIQCIDEMELAFGPEATATFCLLNCWKYRYRAGLKDNGYQDLEKSDWYMRKYKELKEKKECTITVDGTDDSRINLPYNPAPWTITPNWVYNSPITTSTQTEVHL